MIFTCAAVAANLRGARPAFGVWALCISGAGFGGGFLEMRLALDEKPRWRALPAREVSLEVELTRVFPSSADVARRSCVATVKVAPPPCDDLAGQRVFFAARPPAGRAEMLPTMRVRLRGVLEPLGLAPAGPRADATAVRAGFAGYLRSVGVRFRITRAEVIAIERDARALPRFWHTLERRFETILRHALPPSHPATGVYVAMFLGRTSELSEEQKANYLDTGTMHLFAISGLHIGVIALCLQSVLSVVRVPARLAGVAGLGVLWVFVEATGGTPSARRALLMVVFLWGGRVLRRPANAVASLVAAAVVVLVVDPLALLSASFQLSYAVVAALLLYGVPLYNRLAALWARTGWFRDLPETDWGWWRRVVFARGRDLIALGSTSIAATLISTPLAIAYFGIASPGGVLANLVLVPVTGYAIIAGFASLVCGLAGAPALSGVFNHAAALILATVDIVAGWAARMPGMFFYASFSAPWVAPAVMCGLLGMLVTGYAAGWSRLRGSLFLPPAALVVALVLLVTRSPPGRQSAAMKSAYELAMERLKKSDPDAGAKLTDEQKAKLAEIDRVFQGRMAEREIFLKQRLAEAQAKGEAEEIEKLQKQITGERTRLTEEREDEKNRVRREAAR